MKDTQEILNCPGCGNIMAKIKMKQAGIFLDVCLDGCGGIYFDNRELQKFDEQFEDIKELVGAYENKKFEPLDGTIDRVCPVCAGNFVKNHVSVKKEIVVDECYNCGGLFFDFGELEKMRAQYATEKERADAILESVYSGPMGGELAELDERVQEFRASKRYKLIIAFGKIFNH